MDEKKYQVFVSSTYVDLLEARKKIIETVLSLYHFPVGMEMFSADDSEQWDIIRETIEGSDYYVIIIGHKYGSVAQSGLSYTEMEYDYAKSLGIPVLAFIRDRNVGTQPHEREVDTSKSAKLDEFIEKAKANKMCDFWLSIDDLATKVAIALPKIMRRNPRVGWVRGDQATTKEISSELAELSTENRMLREKLRDYESQLQSDIPLLKLTMIEEDLVFKVTDNHCSQSYILPFRREDIPSEYDAYITDEDISEYNNKIPSNEQVDLFNKKAFLNECYEKSALLISPVLKNLGRKVATDIHISVELPDFLVFLNSDNNVIFTSPPTLYVPINPVKAVKRKLLTRKTIASIRESLARGSHVEHDFSRPSFRNELSSNRLIISRPLSAESWVEYNKTKVILRANKLIQSLSVEFDDVTLIPIKLGEGVINFKIVCEELKEPIVYNQKVIVTLSE